MSKKRAIQKAREICEEYDITQNPINIVDICNEMGLKVFEEEMSEDVSGFIIVQEDPIERYGANKVIVINSSDTARRKRFTIAHELAHYCLHRKETDDLYAHRDAGQSDGLEREANIFASNILMPENLVRRVIRRLEQQSWDDIPDFVMIDHIANTFAVSGSAAEVRLSQLGII